ncbi:MAG TPA: S9 family peptidase [Saprospiraceae bacterium]|nr:S9 family peptidase [Saprospiraceae bacterium]
MNLKTTAALFFVFVSLVAVAQQKMITLEEIYEKGVFSPKGLPGLNFMKDGESYTRGSGSRVLRHDLKTGAEGSVLFDASSDAGGVLMNKVSTTAFNMDESKLLIETESESIYRYSRSAAYYVYDLNSKKLQRIFPEGKIKYPKFNPQGDKVAFVYENNLYYQDLNTGRQVQITKDGKRNFIINAAADWVYEEEFTLTRAFEWSPDGSEIAFLRFDESGVKEFQLEYYRDSLYPEPYAFKYPKVGEANARVTAWCYKLSKKKLRALDLGPREDDYLPRLKWTSKANELCLTWLNRNQNQLKLIAVNTQTGRHHVLHEETDAHYIELHDDLTFLKNGQFIWASGKDGFNHLYLHDENGRQIRQLTSGPSEITAFYGLSEDQTHLLVQRAENDGLERKIYRISLNENRFHCLTPEPGTHSAQVSPGLKFLVVSHSTRNQPPVYRLLNAEGESVRVLEDNAAYRETLKGYHPSDIELTKIRNRSNVELNAIMIRPRDFSPVKKYPVLMFLYGGPGSQKVQDLWNSAGHYGWFQMLAQKGYIICIVDNRGTGGRGEAFKKITYMQLGKYETEDQIDAARSLASLPYVDGSRIGIFGWSYGGFMSTLCLLKGNDVFKSAIAVAPVTHWKWYDSVYTERYMRRMSDNQKGYDENSPVLFADRLKGNYLLVHGMADDNVHFQNTAEMANALIKYNKPFESFFYPNRNHGISGQNARIHLFTKITSFVLEKI